MSMYYTSVRSDELYHHGVMGMKWGVRRYQNPDGTLTEKGRKHYERVVGNKRAVNSKAGVAATAVATGGLQLATPLLVKAYGGKNPTRSDWKKAAIRAAIVGGSMAAMQGVAYTRKKKAREILAKDNELKGIKETPKEEKKIELTKNQKTAIKVGAAVAVAGLAVYGGYKVSKYAKKNTGIGLKPSDIEKMTDSFDGPQMVSNRTGRVISDEEAEAIIERAMKKKR